MQIKRPGKMGGAGRHKKTEARISAPSGTLSYMGISRSVTTSLKAVFWWRT